MHPLYCVKKLSTALLVDLASGPVSACSRWPDWLDARIAGHTITYLLKGRRERRSSARYGEQAGNNFAVLLGVY